MSTIKTSDAVLRSYLLGTADEETTFKVDEEFFTDNAFAERIEMIERDLIDDYVNGELGEGERVKFESYYLASPRRSEKVDFAKALRSLSGRQIVAPEIRYEADHGSFWASIFAWRGLIPVAAGLLIVSAFIGWIVLRGPGGGGEVAVNQGQTTDPKNINVPPDTVPPVNEKPAVEPPTNDNRENGANSRNNTESKNTNQNSGANNVKRPAPAIATVVLLPQLRGSGLPTATIPKDAAAADFRLELETEAPGTYDISLTDRGSGANIWSRRGVRSNSAKDRSTITVRIPARIFKNGNYTFSVSGASSTGSEIVGDYTFRVVR
jgi:hypothetical protein